MLKRRKNRVLVLSVPASGVALTQTAEGGCWFLCIRFRALQRSEEGYDFGLTSCGDAAGCFVLHPLCHTPVLLLRFSPSHQVPRFFLLAPFQIGHL